MWLVMLLQSSQQSHLTSESHQLLTETSGWLFIGLTENGPNYVNTKMTLSAWTAKVQLRTMITMQLMLKHAINWLRAAYLWLVYTCSINTLLCTLTLLAWWTIPGLSHFFCTANDEKLGRGLGMRLQIQYMSNPQHFVTLKQYFAMMQIIPACPGCRTKIKGCSYSTTFCHHPFLYAGCGINLDERLSVHILDYKMILKWSKIVVTVIVGSNSPNGHYYCALSVWAHTERPLFWGCITLATCYQISL